MDDYDVLLLVPKKMASEIYETKPDSIDELMFKSDAWLGYAVFGLTLLQHAEWLVDTYVHVRTTKDTNREIKVLRYADHTELEIKNYPLEDVTPELINALYQKTNVDR